MADSQGYNAAVEAFREHEYPMLKGTTLYSKSLVDCFAADMMANLLGNPHSASTSSQAASEMIENTRLQTLKFFGADPTEFDLVFVANATAGIKLVAEAFRALPGGFSYVYHQACHTSLVGVREEAVEAVCSLSGGVEQWIAGTEQPTFSKQCPNTLFAYPAQSNMDGQRFPLSWAGRLRQSDSYDDSNDSDCNDGDSNRVWTLLDAAAYAATSPLDLSNASTAPDFTVVSFYKIFGFPDMGGLIVRRQAEPVFDHRRYFGGGTVDMVVCSSREQWHVSKTQSLHDRLEDGTLPVHNISALGKALQTHMKLFGSMAQVSAHAGLLADRLYAGLSKFCHHNGTPVCRIYSPPRRTAGDTTPGPVIAFNLKNAQGAWVSLTEFDKLATLKKFHVRTGGVCNPGGVAASLSLEPWEMRHNFSHGLRCGSENGGDDIVSGKPTGIIRVSLAAMSTISDVDTFLAFIDEFYREQTPPQPAASPVSSRHASTTSLYVASISVYPIKSCGAFDVPSGSPWEVRPEGLAWDREWCLVHRGTRRALSQKQYPQMALVRPVLDFEHGILRVSYAGKPGEVSVPLSHNPVMFSGSPTVAATAATTTPPRSRESRVCGEEIAAQVYTSSAVNDFFTQALGVPCLLARFPPGGQGKSMRHAKAHLQKHQALYGRSSTNTHPPSPPDSDSERSVAASVAGSGNTSSTDDGSKTESPRPRRILLSNESPILVINAASLRALNDDVGRLHGSAAAEIPASVFRANIVLDSHGGSGTPYAEDGWAHLRIGQQSFKMLGSCRRCHMVCINQETGAKSEEPFVTLTKTRRFDGKIFFGTHMGHERDSSTGEAVSLDTQCPSIIVGQAVTVDG